MDLDPTDIPTDDELEWHEIFINEEAEHAEHIWIDPVTDKICWHRKDYSDTAEYEYYYYYQTCHHIHPEYEKILRDYLCIPTLEELEWETH